MITAPRVAALGLVLLGALAVDAALAADPHGTWLTEGGKSRIRITDCGSALCGSIAWLQEPNDPATGQPKTDKQNADASKRSRPLIGVAIVINMKPVGADKWSGEVYNAEDGKIYTGNITMQSANALRLEGCALGGLLCKGQTWTRVN